MKITIEVQIKAALSTVWDAWVNPEDIVKWNFAIDEWCCPRADIKLEEGRSFSYRMEAKDGSMGFDFEGTFTKIAPNDSIHFKLGDDRIVTVDFIVIEEGVRVVETFDAEDENAAELQKQGWQGILNNFKEHVESKGS